MQRASIYMSRAVGLPFQTMRTFSAAPQINVPNKRKLLAGFQAQTAFLLGVAGAAAQAQLPVDILAVNASSWSSNADSTG